MILLPENSFVNPVWRNFGREIWVIVAKSFGVERVGRKRRICPDDYRTPHIDLLYGRDGWVEHVDNKIRYQYDVTKCMFSIGNITEKLRIAQMDCKGKTVVDMFAGIGYFTLPYLVHAHAAHVYAIDWNPDALEALLRNLYVNKVADRCTVIQGDARKVCPAFAGEHVNLGLLPTAKHLWLTGAKALKPSGGVMHIHDTVTSAKMERKTSLPAIPLALNGKEENVCEPKTRAKPMPKQLSLCKAEDFEKLESESSSSEHKPTENGVAVVENGEGAEENSDKFTDEPPFDGGTGRKGKFRRAASILEEMESKPRHEPVVCDEFRFEFWDKLDPAWRKFSMDAAIRMTGYLNNLHEDLNWQCKILRIGKVKSYAPHVDHVVLDLECRPVE